MKKTSIVFLIIVICLSANILKSQDTLNDGNWSEPYVVIYNTPQAEMMVRVGDIDNLNFGWPSGFNPFSGQNTPVHDYPWTVNPDDPTGTDRIMVISSYSGTPPNGRDGYTGTTSRPANIVAPITLRYNLDTVEVNRALLQIFVDDFQASLWKASYEVYINNVRVPFMEGSINSLLQTGPIGKMITVEIPENYLYLLESDSCSILFDDNTTGAGDGYAIDFVKLLINHSDLGQYVTVQGAVTNNEDGSPIDSARITANGLQIAYTNSEGYYSIDSISAGLVTIRTYKPGYGNQTKNISLFTGQVGTLNFSLTSPAPEVLSVFPSKESIVNNLNDSIEVLFNEDIDTSTIHTSNFIFSDKNQTISGIFSVRTNGFTFYPNTGFKPSMQYTATIKSTLKNIYGVNLAEDYIWTFTSREPNLQERIDAATNGDTILLEEKVHFGLGNYYLDPTCGNCDVPTYNIPVTKGIIVKDKEIHLIGTSRNNSIIETKGGYGVIFDNAGNSSLSNLTITGGINDTSEMATDAGIVVRNTKLDIYDLNIIENQPDNNDYPGIAGIAIREGANVIIDNCTIKNNSWDGIALYRGEPYGISARAHISYNTIGWDWDGEYQNASGIGTTHDAEATIIGNDIFRFWKGVGAHGNSKIVAKNNIVRDMQGWGMAFTEDAVMQAENNIIVNCNRTGLLLYGNTVETYFVNNIILNNGNGSYNLGDEPWPSAGVVFPVISPAFSFTYNDIWNNAGGRNIILFDSTNVNYIGIMGNISEDPNFWDITMNDFELQCPSPAVDGGDPAITDHGGSRSDMGIFGGLNSTQYPTVCPTITNSKSIVGNTQVNVNIIPTPVNNTFVVNYFLKKDSKVEIRLISIDGQLISHLLQEMQVEGNKTIGFDRNLSNGEYLEAGNYFVVISTNENQMVGKLIVGN